MKKLLLTLVLATSIVTTSVTFTACTTNQQKIAYNSLYSIEASTTSSYDAYIDLVLKGSLPTNDVPNISKKYNQFQLGFMIALDGVQYNTNALAPENLVTESKDIINLINGLKYSK